MKVQASISAGIFLVIVIAAVCGILVLTYNGIIVTEKSVEESKANIESVMQRRLDLIPNLVETVKGYAQHESQTLLAVTQARAQAQNVLKAMGSKPALSKDDMATLAASQRQLGTSIQGLFAVIEKYPDLRASSNFLALQDQLEGTENRINVARVRYNNSVKRFNTKITMFPGVIVAPMFGFEEKESFEATPGALEAVTVQF